MIHTQGEKKQQQWIENLQAIASNPDKSLDKDVKDLLNGIMEFENIPRKRAKFVNFVKNVRRGVRPATIDKTWELFEEALKQKKPVDEKPKEKPSDTGNVPDTNGRAEKEEVESKEEDSEDESRDGVKMFKGTKRLAPDGSKRKKDKKSKKKQSDNIEEAPEPETKKSKKKKDRAAEENVDPKEGKKGKKRKKDAEGEESPESEQKKPKMDLEQTPNDSGKKAFNWEDAIESVLTKKGGEVKVTRLRKKVVDECVRCDAGGKKTQEQLFAKFNKKLEKSKRFKVHKNVVSFKNRARDEAEADDAKNGGSSGGLPDGAILATKVAENSPFVKKQSFNKWEKANLGDNQSNEKFRRLMGMGKGKAAVGGKAPNGDADGPSAVGSAEQTKAMLDRQEEQFEKARAWHHKAKGSGLGFNS